MTDQPTVNFSAIDDAINHLDNNGLAFLADAIRELDQRDTWRGKEVQRLTDELDARESSGDQAATREIDLRVERDEARKLARGLRGLHYANYPIDDDPDEPDKWITLALALDALPDWLTAEPHAEETPR